MKKTRRVLRPWLEKLLKGILTLNFVIMVTTNDFTSLTAMIIVYGALISSSVIIFNLLMKYGRTFKRDFESFTAED